MWRPFIGRRVAALALGAGLAVGGAAISRVPGAAEAAQETNSAVARPVTPVPFCAKANKRFLAVYTREADYPANPRIVENLAVFRRKDGRAFAFRVMQVRRDPADAKRLILTLRTQTTPAPGALRSAPLDEPEDVPEPTKRAPAVVLSGEGDLLITVVEVPPTPPQPIPVIGIDDDPCQ